MARPQQSTIVKSSVSQHCSSPSTYGPGKKNHQSTKYVKSEVEIDKYRDFYPDLETVKTHELCATIIPFDLNRKGFSDITGAFPHKSSRGDLYAMVLCDYDINTILSKPIKIGRQQPSAMLSSISTRSSKKDVATQNFTLWTASVLVT